MYNHILVAYDGSEGAKKALNNGLELAKRMNVKLTALWVGGFKAYYHESVAEVEQEEKAIESFSSKIKKELKEVSLKMGVEIHYSHVQGNPAKLICEYAIKNNVDLIIMGCAGHSRLWGNDLGHVTDKVSENAKCNVLIARK